MRRCLVVANRTLGGDHLIERIRAHVASGPCSFHVLVPATPEPNGWTHDEGGAHALASERLKRAIARIGELDVEVTGEVGDELPFDAVMDVLRRESFDEIILSTLPVGISRWLGMDVLSRLERATDVPIDHVIGPEEPDGGRG